MTIGGKKFKGQFTYESHGNIVHLSVRFLCDLTFECGEITLDPTTKSAWTTFKKCTTPNCSTMRSGRGKCTVFTICFWDVVRNILIPTADCTPSVVWMRCRKRAWNMGFPNWVLVWTALNMFCVHPEKARFTLSRVRSVLLFRIHMGVPLYLNGTPMHQKNACVIACVNPHGDFISPASTRKKWRSKMHIFG